MNILYLCQLFEIGNDPGSERHYFFCKYAVNKGHRATAITSNVDYKKACVKISGRSGTVHRSAEGVDIYYVYSYANFRGSFLRRFFYFLTYFFSAVVCSLKIEKSDVVYAVSTPLTVGLLGYIISRIRRTPFIFEVTDVWPDAAVACGVVKNKALIKLAHCLELFCYQKAAYIVCLTHGIRDSIYAKGVPLKKLSIITNGVDFSLFNHHGDHLKRKEVRAQLGLANHFVSMYMGAHGAYNALDTIIDAAVELKNDPRFLFVLIGDGDEKPKLQRRAKEKGLNNVRFLNPVPRTEAPTILSAADAFVLPNRRGQFFSGNLPNKLFDYLASGRPIVVSGLGETSELVISAECGKVVEAEDGLGMAKSIVELAEINADERIQMGARGRNYVLAHYDRIQLSERFLEILVEGAKY